MLLKLSENQDTVELTENKIWITANVDPQTRYLLEGKIASDVLSRNSALCSIHFLDFDQNVIEKPYEGFPFSMAKGIGYYQYIPINSKSLSVFQIKMRTHPEAHYLRCGFQSWGTPKAPVFLASEIEFVKPEEKLNISSSILVNDETSASQDLKFVSDKEGRKLYYDVRLALNNPQESPILICFYGWGGNTGGLDSSFCYSWNLVKPLDRFGYRKNGSWWLGENGNFFVLPLIDNMLEDIREEFGLVGDLFVWGSSMGGFGALIHGLRLNAKAIAVNVPQVRLKGNDYLSRNRKAMEAVLGNELASLNYDEFLKLLEQPENSKLMYTDATLLLNHSEPTKKPMFFISQSRFDGNDNSRLYAQQHCFYLVNKLLDLGCNFELYIEPKEGHYIIRNWFEAIELFEKYKEIINSPICYPNLTINSQSMNFQSMNSQSMATELLNFYNVNSSDILRWDKEWTRYLCNYHGSQYFGSLTDRNSQVSKFIKDIFKLSADEVYDFQGPASVINIWCDSDNIVDKKIVELGCGPGQLGKQLGHLAVHYLGLDYSNLALYIARIVSPMSCEYINIGDKSSIAKFRNSRDTVVTRHFYIHQNISNAIWVTRLAHFLLKPEGLLIADFYYPTQEDFEKNNPNFLPAKSSLQQHPSAVFYFSTDEINEVADLCGFKIVDEKIDSARKRRFVQMRKRANVNAR